jgi:hypothetical protein
MNWFSTVRALVRVSREVRLLRESTERIAAALERAYPAPTEVPEAAEPPLEIANSPMDFGRLDALSTALQHTLGREPDSEELLRAYEGEAEIRTRGRRV